MSSRYVPYAATPTRLLRQLLGDVAVSCWSVLWVVVGLAVYAAVATIADVGRQLHDGADGVAGSLGSAGDGAQRVPLIGGALASPLRAAGDAATGLAGAGHDLDATASWLAVVLAIAVAGPPLLAVAVPWLVARVRFVRRKAAALRLAGSTAGEELLALRALATRPLTVLDSVGADPVGGWRRHDPVVIRALADVELRRAGVVRRR